jgi:hypothetical protein
MTEEQELDDHGRHPTLWRVNAVTWVLENPDYTSRILLGVKIEDPAAELTMTKHLESVDAPDLDHAIAAAHALLDKHSEQVGEYALEIYVNAPQPPHAEEERLGIRQYKLTPEALKQARAIGLRGRDIEARVARLVRHATPFEHPTANLRFRGIIMRVEDDHVTWIDLAVPPRRRRRKAK